MRRWTIRVELSWVAEALRASGYRGENPAGGRIEGVSIDTRTGCSGMLFVALEGSRSDGHEYAARAVEHGAAALLVMRGREPDPAGWKSSVPVFAVPDTLTALQDLASAYRDRIDPRVVAVTGSTGKTGTKDFIARILSTAFMVHATPGNMNNHIGLPLTLLGMEGTEELLVTEMGANHRGEIKRLSGIARPGVGIVTNIGPVHLEFFGSLKGVAAAKSELLAALPADGTAVLPADDEFFEFLKGKTKAPVISFGYCQEADLRIEDVELLDGPGYRFRLGGHEMEIPRYGRHNIRNAAAAAAAASVCGVRPEQIAAAVAGTKAADGRGVVFDIDGILFVDESYNSNPDSLTAAMDAFKEMPVKGKRWLVLGDMLELGEKSGELHGEAGSCCGKAGVDGIVTMGEETVELNRAAAVQRKAPDMLSHFLDHEKCAAYLNDLLETGDAVLVKGSRGMHMERIIEAIEKLKGTEARRVD